MKPPPFSYYDPATVEEALQLLAEKGDDGKILAGGQSLVPLLNFRLAHPETLIDINRLGELAGIKRSGGRLEIGAMTRHTAVENSAIVSRGWPLLTEALSYVAHPQIRNRGTFGGSVAHADPAAEIPVAVAAMDAEVRVLSLRGERRIPVKDLFITHLTNSLEFDELLVALEVPAMEPHTGYAFVEFARRHGDFALGGAAILVTLAADGTCRKAAISLLGAAPTPYRATAGEQVLVDSKPDEVVIAEAAAASVAEIEPTGDIHGSGEYRKNLIEALVRRGLAQAVERSQASHEEGGGSNDS